jgi:lipoyl(octanoyl) transferase
MTNIEWQIESRPVAYETALADMAARIDGIRGGGAAEMIWLLEHPPLYTAGTSARAADLNNPAFPVYDTGRGGQFTYHGPGQRVGYVMLDLKKRQQVPDIKKYVSSLEEWIIRALAEFGIKGERREGRVGIWVAGNGIEEKIAAIGVRISRWVTWHGVSINLNPDLAHFAGIVPCGIREHGVTSFEKLGVKASMAELDAALQKSWPEVF